MTCASGVDIALYDIYKDLTNRKVIILRKRGKGDPIDTYTDSRYDYN